MKMPSHRLLMQAGPYGSEQGGVFLEYVLALCILLVIFLSVSVWMDLAVNDRVDKAINSVVEMAPCADGGVLSSYDACY